MQTKRGSVLAGITALILTILLELVSAALFIQYNVITTIISAILYYSIMVFIVVDGYNSVKNENIYYKFSLVRDVAILEVLLIIFYCCGNFEMATVIITIIALVILLCCIKKLNKLADLYNKSK